MAEGEGTRQAGSRLGWFVIALVWLVFGALFLWGRGGLFDYLQAKKQLEALQAQAEALEAENAALVAEMKDLSESPEAYEAAARERLFLKKPGEVILYLPADGGLPPAPAQTPQPEPPVPP